MTTTSTPPRTRSAAGARPLALVAVVAALVAALVNAGIYLVGRPLGAFPSDVLIQAGMPMTLVPIVSLSILATLVAGGAYAVVRRFTTRPTRVFLILAAVVLVAMAIPPFAIAGAPAAMIVALQLTHLTTAAIAVVAFTRVAAPR